MEETDEVRFRDQTCYKRMHQTLDLFYFLQTQMSYHMHRLNTHVRLIISSFLDVLSKYPLPAASTPW